MLLDEGRPLAERYDEATRTVRGLGQAVATPILHVVYPARYGVWNSKSEAGLGALGIDTQGQARRIKRQPVLLKGHSWVDILSTQPTPQRRRSQVLRVDLVPLFLTGISTQSIGEAANRAKLERFQEEAAKVLWEAFQEGRLTAESSFDDLLSGASPETVQAYHCLLYTSRCV